MRFEDSQSGDVNCWKKLFWIPAVKQKWAKEALKWLALCWPVASYLFDHRQRFARVDCCQQWENVIVPEQQIERSQETSLFSDARNTGCTRGGRSVGRLVGWSVGGRHETWTAAGPCRKPWGTSPHCRLPPTTSWCVDLCLVICSISQKTADYRNSSIRRLCWQTNNRICCSTTAEASATRWRHCESIGNEGTRSYCRWIHCPPRHVLDQNEKEVRCEANRFDPIEYGYSIESKPFSLNELLIL